VSTVDLIAFAVIALASFSGFRRGLVVGVFSLAGLAFGFYLGARVGPSLIGGDLTRWLPLVALGVAMVCAAIGQMIGSMAGRHLRRALLVLGPLRLFDNVGGGVLGAVTGLALCWAVGAVLLYLPRQTELRHYAQDSAILSKLNQELPPHRLIDTLAQIDPFTSLAGPAAAVDAPDPAVLDSAGVSNAALSVVRVVGTACGLGIEGSGWVAGPGLVVTNAHVVAGIGTPRVDRNDGRLLDANVVSFDRVNDVAVLRVPGLAARALPLANAEPGTPAGLLGYPGNGPYHETAVRVGRTVQIVGRDAYGSFPIARRVTTIRGTIRSGNSGGPVVDAGGRVIATVFAQRVGSDGGYGVPTDVVRAAIAAAGVKPLETTCVDR
jgi:S1-C subfamily serine protease